jgi:acetyltransferase-like isoleucine patch superfamily enzyme
MLLVNPATLWLGWLLRTARLKVQYSGRGLCIGYMAVAKRTQFGRMNTLSDFARLDRVTMGDMSYVSRGTRITNAVIGKFTCIGPESLVGLGRHPTEGYVSSHPAFYSLLGQTQLTFVSEQKFEEFLPIAIGSDVWIGARTIVLDGAEIGDGAIVAAGSVVSGTIPPYAIVGGVPARVIRYRFDEDVVTQLLESRWWDLSFEILRENSKAFESIEAFFEWRARQTEKGT